MSLEYAIVSFTIEKLGEVLVKEAELLSDVEDQVQSLQRELTWMQSYLKDVDEAQEEGNETKRLRNREIRKISFDAEDVIDSFILAGGTKRKESLLRRYACRFNSLVHAHQLATEIKSIKTRIRENTEMLERYQVGGTTESIRRRRPRSYPHGDDDYVVGPEDDIDKLVEQLTQKNNLAYFLCIVGMGGSGKTTLARKLYNHQIIKRYFQCQAWVSISQEWNAQHILVEILRQATGQTKKAGEIGSIEELVDELREYLKQTPYLIVLDDVWKEESMEDLLPAFPIKSKGSRIIVTTRIHKVVQFPGMSCMIHEPRRLTEGESWDLFSKIAWNQRQSTGNDLCNGNFEKLGKEMLKKCDGLPLAIIALGGLLGEMDTIEEWERVSKAVSAKVMGSRGTQMYGSVKDMIALSYKELPYDLKPYFLYLSLFQEDFEIPVGMLTRMWIAEGFIRPQQLCVGETLEDVARQFLDELIRRCVVQIVSKNYEGKAKEVRIHDLMRDFGVKKAKELEFLEILTSESSVTSSTIEDGIIVQSRRIGNHSSSSMCVQFGTQDSHVRSLIMMDKSFFSWKKARVSSLEHVYKNFRLLRVLCIWGISTSDGTLPSEIGDLIHLRYLGLRWTNIRVFPKSFGQLRNLLTFECSHLAQYRNTEISIPNVLWKMDQLRHLLLPFRAATEEEYLFHTLKNLQSLRGVVGGEWMLKEMPTLSPTVKRLCIEDVSSMEQLDAVFQCPSVSFRPSSLFELRMAQRKAVS